MIDQPVVIITGTSKGIGKYLSEHYVNKGFIVIGCSRRKADFEFENYHHFIIDVCKENEVKDMFKIIRQTYGRLDVLINNAGIASMNHILITPLTKTKDVLETNIIGTFLFCREAGKLMKINKYGRIVNFSTIATKLKVEGEAIYAASKAAVMNFTETLSKEYAEFGITVNVIAPTPINTDLIKQVPKEKIDTLTERLAIKRLGKLRDISNVTDFFISKKSDFITGQTIFLGGV